MKGDPEGGDTGVIKKGSYIIEKDQVQNCCGKRLRYLVTEAWAWGGRGREENLTGKGQLGGRKGGEEKKPYFPGLVSAIY